MTAVYQKSSLHPRLQHFDAVVDVLQPVQQLQVVVYHEEEGAASDEVVSLRVRCAFGDGIGDALRLELEAGDADDVASGHELRGPLWK